MSSNQTPGAGAPTTQENLVNNGSNNHNETCNSNGNGNSNGRNTSNK